jgi:predicted 2-oxoglutarate/Fe(II)-dependent dioxygenase YbiX
MKRDERTYYGGALLSAEDMRASLLEEPSGAVLMREALPPGLFIVQNLLGADVCQRIVQAAGRLKGQAAGVLSGSGKTLSARNVDTRKTEHFPAEDISPDLNTMVRAAYLDLVSQHFRSQLEWYELPRILRYRHQGEYTAHADAYNWDDGEKQWRRVADRDYSLLIYLNEDFEGGELEFKYLNFKVAPRQGMLLAFPSDWRYAHAALPVAGGEKLVIVSFAAACGAPRLDRTTPANLIRFSS